MQTQSVKNFQFTCRMPKTLQNKIQKRLLDMGCTSFSEYLRLVVINDIEGYEGLIGQSILPEGK